MPLRAFINDKEVISPLLNEHEWETLRSEIAHNHWNVTLPCCGAKAYLRTSKYGVQHFVHDERDICTSKPETWQHLRAKHDIVLACQRSGYESSTEVLGDGWRADVLATKENIRIVFEVQWSVQTLEVTKQRQKLYKNAGIRCCWFFRKVPKWAKANYTTPMFELNVTENGCTVSFAPSGDYSWYGQHLTNRNISLTDFIGDLLNGNIRFCNKLKSKHFTVEKILFFRTRCCRCTEPYYIYEVHGDFNSLCGEKMYVDKTQDLILSRPEIIEAIRKFSDSHVDLCISNFNNNVFHCPHCLTPYDDILRSGFSRSEMALVEEIVVNIQVSISHKHWCLSNSREFCCI